MLRTLAKTVVFIVSSPVNTLSGSSRSSAAGGEFSQEVSICYTASRPAGRTFQLNLLFSEKAAMKKRTNPVSMFVMIAVIGLLVSLTATLSGSSFEMFWISAALKFCWSTSASDWLSWLLQACLSILIVRASQQEMP